MYPHFAWDNRHYCLWSLKTRGDFSWWEWSVAGICCLLSPHAMTLVLDPVFLRCLSHLHPDVSAHCFVLLQGCFSFLLLRPSFDFAQIYLQCLGHAACPSQWILRLVEWHFTFTFNFRQTRLWSLPVSMLEYVLALALLMLDLKCLGHIMKLVWLQTKQFEKYQLTILDSCGCTKSRSLKLLSLVLPRIIYLFHRLVQVENVATQILMKYLYAGVISLDLINNC